MSFSYYCAPPPHRPSRYLKNIDYGDILGVRTVASAELHCALRLYSTYEIILMETVE